MLAPFVSLFFSSYLPLIFLKGVLASDNLFGDVSLSLSFPLLFALIWNFFRLSFLLSFSLPPPPLSVVKLVFLKKKKESGLKEKWLYESGFSKCAV